MFVRSIVLLVCSMVASTLTAQVGPVIGDSYFIAPGAGTVSGFQLAGGPFENSTINSNGELIGVDFGGGEVLSSDTLIQHSPTNFELIFRLESVGGNLLPSGIVGDSDAELTSLGIFIGGGIDPVDLAAPIIAETAVIEAFSTAGDSIGTIDDIIYFSNFQTGPGGGWDGSFGLNFGNQIPIGDVGAVEFRVTFSADAIPEPTTAGVLGVLVVCAFGRRRR